MGKNSMVQRYGILTTHKGQNKVFSNFFRQFLKNGHGSFWLCWRTEQIPGRTGAQKRWKLRWNGGRVMWHRCIGTHRCGRGSHQGICTGTCRRLETVDVGVVIDARTAIAATCAAAVRSSTQRVQMRPFGRIAFVFTYKTEKLSIHWILF